MFTKLPHQNHSFSHHFHFSHSDDTLTANHGGGGDGSTIELVRKLRGWNTLTANHGGGGDGSTIELVRKLRGRPPGSKNKPKPPLIITQQSDPSMTPCILEIQPGNNVVEAIAQFSRRKSIGLSIFTGSGTVSNVTLCQPSTTSGLAATVTFHGRFDILSLSATFLPQTASCNNHHVRNTFSVSLAGPQGKIIGGFVAGKLVAAGTVVIVAGTFNNASCHQLTENQEEEEEEEEEEAKEEVGNMVSSGGGGGGGGEGQSPPPGGGSMYSRHLGAWF